MGGQSTVEKTYRWPRRRGVNPEATNAVSIRRSRSILPQLTWLV